MPWKTKVLADPEQLKQVLINLVQNAAEALGKGGTIKLRAVESRIALGGRMREVVIIEVEDNGTGIPPEVQEAALRSVFHHQAERHGPGPLDRCADRRETRRRAPLPNRREPWHDLRCRAAGGAMSRTRAILLSNVRQQLLVRLALFASPC